MPTATFTQETPAAVDQRAIGLALGGLGLPNLCGPRALAALLHAAGIETTELELIARTSWSPRGTNFAGLKAAVEYFGLPATGLKTTVARLGELLEGAVGAVLALEGAHFAAVLGAGTDGFDIFDPRHSSWSRSWWSTARVEECWTGNALVVHRGKVVR